MNAFIVISLLILIILAGSIERRLIKIHNILDYFHHKDKQK
jgi:hypothetical protein